MSLENNPWGGNNVSAAEEAKAEAYLKELTATYPTPESIVDDYRHDVISQLAMPRRFPDPEDQRAIMQMVEERNAADKEIKSEERKAFSEKYVEPLLTLANSLHHETLRLIVGEDEWEQREFTAQLEVALNKRADGETLSKAFDVLTQIKSVETSEDPAKGEKIRTLAEEFNSLV